MKVSRRQLLVGLVAGALAPVLPKAIERITDISTARCPWWQSDIEYWQRKNWDYLKAKYHAQAYGMSDEHFKHWWMHREMHRRLVQQDRSGR